MNIIDHYSESIARSIRKHNSNAGSEIALKYALSLLINTTTAIVVSLLICTYFGHLDSCLMGIATFLAIRFITGGLHLSSSLSCCIMSILIFICVGLSAFSFNNFYLFIDLISILIFYKTAPNDIQFFSSLDAKFYPLLKLLAITFVLSNLIFHSTVLTSAFFIQAILTTQPAYKLRDFIGRRCTPNEN
ncbi:accessory gene regulator B family protein [Paenibacillus periandrae]|uniref:accessory gene regulator B family protein n=1 Tax=Paenibacillus periandrae TaxID=1761741 RepID=UPI001F08E79D|nr:accessory gene regulator B family protein [Paenibacillus periandrae]